MLRGLIAAPECAAQAAVERAAPMANGAQDVVVEDFPRQISGPVENWLVPPARAPVAENLQAVPPGRRVIARRTQVEHELEVTPTGAFKLFSPMMGVMGRKNLRDTANALKAHLEQRNLG